MTNKSRAEIEAVRQHREETQAGMSHSSGYDSELSWVLKLSSSFPSNTFNENNTAYWHKSVEWLSCA